MRLRWLDDAERVLERTIRYELALLPNGTYRRRALRTAFEDTWSSLLQAPNRVGERAQSRDQRAIDKRSRQMRRGK